METTILQIIIGYILGFHIMKGQKEASSNIEAA